MEHEEIMPGNEEEKNEEDRELIVGDNLEVITKKLDGIEKKWDKHERKD